MEELSAAVAKLAPLLEALQEAAAVQACGRCCLRLAGVRNPAAYSSTSLPASAAGVVAALQIGTPAAEDAADGSSLAAAAASDDGSKRRRVEPAQQGQPNAAAAAAGADEAAPSVCPLCLGLLQAAPLSGSSSSSSSSSLLPPLDLKLVTTVSTLNDPTRHAATVWGAPAAAAAADAAADGEAATGEAAGEAPGGISSYAPLVEQRSSAVASLAAAAEAIAAEYEFDSFGLEVSLPASLAVRHQAFVWRLQQRQQRPQHEEDAEQPERQQRQQGAAASLSGAVGAKEAVKLCYESALSAALGKPHDAQASLRISLTASHPAAAAECGWLAPSGGGAGGRRARGRGRHGRQQQQQQQQDAQAADVPALSDAVVQRLAALAPADFAASCPPAAAQLAAPAAVAALTLQPRRLPVHVGGRYLKLRRGIPQSPWFIDCQRKGEGSVQEAVEQVLLPSLQADSYTMVSAGREDIDVRMMGEGRPFVLEIHNARRAVPPPAELARLEARVLQASASGVAVRGLFAASAGQLALLKEGEQEKQKSYVAVCWLPRPLTDADAALLAAARDLEVLQETPVRVLHRRANLSRPRTVHEMRAERLPGQPPGYFRLHLRTQAGAYIKEFVHGDLGRTRPSLGDLLGCPAQIVSLDVARIHMDFPGAMTAAAGGGG